MENAAGAPNLTAPLARPLQPNERGRSYAKRRRQRRYVTTADLMNGRVVPSSSGASKHVYPGQSEQKPSIDEKGELRYSLFFVDCNR